MAGDVNEGGVGSEQGCEDGWWLSHRALWVVLVGLAFISSKVSNCGSIFDRGVM